MFNLVGIDRKLDSIENTLSNIAAFPVAGTLAGSTIAILGIIQTTTAIAVGILIFIPSVQSENWTLVHYSWTHIKHGLGNIVGGVFSAIPIVGTAMYFYRQMPKNSVSQVYINSGHEHKFMPYASLIEQDWYFDGLDAEAIKNAKERFATKTIATRFSGKKRLEVAQDLLRGTV